MHSIQKKPFPIGFQYTKIETALTQPLTNSKRLRPPKQKSFPHQQAQEAIQIFSWSSN